MILKCYVLIDLKVGQVSHADVGQMDMYVRMYDELKRTEGDGPTLGIVLCSETSADIAHYSCLVAATSSSRPSTSCIYRRRSSCVQRSRPRSRYTLYRLGMATPRYVAGYQGQGTPQAPTTYHDASLNGRGHKFKTCIVMHGGSTYPKRNNDADS